MIDLNVLNRTMCMTTLLLNDMVELYSRLWSKNRSFCTPLSPWSKYHVDIMPHSTWHFIMIIWSKCYRLVPLSLQTLTAMTPIPSQPNRQDKIAFFPIFRKCPRTGSEHVATAYSQNVPKQQAHQELSNDVRYINIGWHLVYFLPQNVFCRKVSLDDVGTHDSATSAAITQPPDIIIHSDIRH